MATYAIGDLQGCCRELEDLLLHIRFNPENDRLWFTGDLVNRGPESLQALRFVHALGDAAIVVLGNHDLHLLAVAGGHAAAGKHDTLDPILESSDRDELLDWLRRRPLLHHDAALGFTLIHAGLAPQWDLAQAASLAAEVEDTLRGESCGEFLAGMYGDKPRRWREDLTGSDRLRFITNCFTRLRFCDADGRVAMKEKGAPGSQPASLLPWYEITARRTRQQRILFGHWSTIWLQEHPDFARWNVFPLDKGCVWGGELAAVRLEDQRPFSVPSRQPKQFAD